MTASFDVERVRSMFPALASGAGPDRDVFFDGPGGTQVPARVIEAITSCLTDANANLHGPFRTSREADSLVAEAHRAAADLLGCSEREVIYGPNMTTLAFWLSRSLACEFQPGDEVIVTRLDHDANHAPWISLAEHGIRVREVPFRREDCTLDLDDLRSKLSSRTKLVAVGYASNAVGTISDVATVVREAHAAGARVFVDAVHFAPHGPIDVRDLDFDFLACSVYKFFGPHQGVLYGKLEHLERLRAYKVRPAGNSLPGRFETGTQNHECMAGSTAAINHLADLGGSDSGSVAASRRERVLAGMRAVREYERGLSVRLLRGLDSIPEVETYGITDESRFEWRTPTFGIRVRGKSPKRVAEELGERRIFVWDGNFYALNVTEDLGLEESGGLVRIGLVHYNTASEIDRLIRELRVIATRP